MNAALFHPSGYNTDFLDVPLPLPAPAAGTLMRELAYTHFTVLLDPARRLAISTGVNIDGDQLVTVDRGDNWHLDSRIPVYEQAGEALYARNDLDRGHLVRRQDPVWGNKTIAQQANYDTFAYTNAAPQAAAFNQSKQLWLGLEDHVLTYARSNGNRISVFTAPVLSAQDPIYRGVKIPHSFWKIAAWTTTTDDSTALYAAGFVLDQSPQLEDLDLDLDMVRAQARTDGTPPPLGPYRTYQVPIVDIVDLTGLDLTALSQADVYAPAPAIREGTDRRARWVELGDTTSIQL
ncbi:DNA/RNA non-specific endonuclease [Cryobacterium melibiosiphilum]|uniref:DNA/RNA non-specific endonuclease n=1 Tax=Cryobacterium melibiosiphilum TaxID=995039 RepID=A0A3A5MIH0_9MICO|nr:DNA/RNA non-specific endonuclease [Cryobacterium melibiosiphilum]RJT89970.1 DNA/RNA non-specific endonuclease [Cryobacterium melibiosiphilum]